MAESQRWDIFRGARSTLAHADCVCVREREEDQEEHWEFGVERERRRGRQDGYQYRGAKTHVYDGPPLLSCAFCCSVVIIGLSSCFLRFLPLLPLDDDAALATCLALLIAAFLMSDPFIVKVYLETERIECQRTWAETKGVDFDVATDMRLAYSNPLSGF